MIPRRRASPLTRREAKLAEARALHERERRAARPGASPVRGRALEAFLFRYLPHAFGDAPGEFHRSIYSLLESLVLGAEIDGAPRSSAALAYPRLHGKTTTCTLGFAAYVLYHWREMPCFHGRPPFILIVSDTLDQARDRSLDLRDEVEGNPDLRKDFGSRAPAPADRNRQRRGTDGKFESHVKWTETDWTTSDGCRVKALGAGGKVRGLLRRGRRPSLVIVDDLENDEAVETEARRDKLERWFSRALIPVGLPDRCLYLVVGTVLHADSLLSRLLKPDLFDHWLKRRFAACYTSDGTAAIPAPLGPGTVSLWPAVWTLERLARRFLEIRSLAFAQEYLNQPVDNDNSPFRREWLEAAMEAGRGIGFAYEPLSTIDFGDAIASWDLRNHPDAATHYQVVVTAWDLALVVDEKQARERDSDFTCGITIGLTCAEELEVRRVYRKRGQTPAAMRDRIVTEDQIVDPSYVVIENVAAQMIAEWDLKGMIGAQKVVGHQTDRKKRSLYEGVPALALVFETGRIRLCWANDAERLKLETLVSELHGLGIERHDDTVMALWMGARVIQRWIRRRNQHRQQRGVVKPATVADSGIFPAREEGRP